MRTRQTRPSPRPSRGRSGTSCSCSSCCAIFKQPWQLLFATIIIPTILMVLLIAWPFLDTGRDRRLSRRPAGVALGLATPAVLIALTIAGGSAPGVARHRDHRLPRLECAAGAALNLAQGCTVVP